MGSRRLAVVKATGKRYVVQQLNFDSEIAHCWGELVKLVAFERRDGSWAINVRYEEAQAIPLADVEIIERNWTVKLARNLLDQAQASHDAARQPPPCELCTQLSSTVLDGVVICDSCYGQLTS